MASLTRSRRPSSFLVASGGRVRRARNKARLKTRMRVPTLRLKELKVDLNKPPDLSLFYSPSFLFAGMPRTQGSTKTPTKKGTLSPKRAANCRSPLRQHNTTLDQEVKTPEKLGKEDVDSLTPAKKTPVAKCESRLLVKSF